MLLTRAFVLSLLIAGVARADTVTAPPTTPGGATTTVQFNNAGAFGGITNLTSDGTNPIQTALTAAPAAPVAGVLPFVRKGLAITMPAWPFQIDAVSTLTMSSFPFAGISAASPTWGCSTPAGHSNTFAATLGSYPNTGTVGTAGVIAQATTNIWTRFPKINYLSALGAGSSAERVPSGITLWRGDAAGRGGFFFWQAASIESSVAQQRSFFGLAPGTGSLPNGNPSALLNTVYFGADAATANLSICGNDNAGTATCNTLGASYLAMTVGAAYNMYLWATPNASSISWAIERLDSAASTSGSITLAADLPQTTSVLGPRSWINNGTTASGVQLNFGGACFIAGP